MAQYQTVDIDTIADQGARVEDGTYTFRLKEAKGSDKKVMTIAEFEVVSGEFEGFTATKFFLLINKNKKTGNEEPFSLGILDVKKSLAAIGKPLEPGFPFPLDGEAVAKLLTKRFGNMKVTGVVATTKNKTTQKEFSGLTITGPAIQTVVEDVEEFEDQNSDEYDYASV
jgi:hypothetical protein